MYFLVWRKVKSNLKEKAVAIMPAGLTEKIALPAIKRCMMPFCKGESLMPMFSVIIPVYNVEKYLDPVSYTHLDVYKRQALETVLDGRTGLFFTEQTAENLMECIQRFEAQGVEYDRTHIRQHSLSFSEERFRNEVSNCVNRCNL